MLPESEYNPYYGHYINLVADKDLRQAFSEGMLYFQEFVSEIPEELMHYSYDEGKWTVAELLLHLIDAERVFQHRAFRFARNDKTVLPGFEQDTYVPESFAKDRIKKDILEEFISVRTSTIHLFNTFSDEVLKRMGDANGSPISVRALGYIINGHQVHHLNILKTRYL